MAYLIDGNNLLWVMLGQRPVQPSGIVPGHCVQLAWAISRYLGKVGQEAEIVFDGPEPQDIARFQNIPHLTVWFAGPGRQADAWIEERLRSFTAETKLIVVSSDRHVRQAAIHAGAGQIRSETFWDQVLLSQADQQDILEPPAKVEGISQAETDLWMRIFGIKEDQ
ncbi:MAG: NYN domain-containing protein [Sedimentisphaerales bacterium]|nr:NYN domain-containing protein [Sedimentisphaerales bacterium]